VSAQVSVRRLASRLRDVRPPSHVGIVVFLLISFAALGAALWGSLFADPGITITRFDAGPVGNFAIGKVTAYPEIDLYVVGLQDGRVRALDGRVRASGCSVQWLPDDMRAQAANPAGARGAFVDPCSGAVWSMEGNAVSGSNVPLRTPQVSLVTHGDGLHVHVELINQPKAR
jgi:hypothetical protein